MGCVIEIISVFLSLCLSVSLSLCLSVFVSVSVSLSLSPSVSISLSQNDGNGYVPEKMNNSLHDFVLYITDTVVSSAHRIETQDLAQTHPLPVA